jgi:hypothetical protein
VFENETPHIIGNNYGDQSDNNYGDYDVDYDDLDELSKVKKKKPEGYSFFPKFLSFNKKEKDILKEEEESRVKRFIRYSLDDYLNYGITLDYELKRAYYLYNYKLVEIDNDVSSSSSKSSLRKEYLHNLLPLMNIIVDSQRNILKYVDENEDFLRIIL